MDQPVAASLIAGNSLEPPQSSAPPDLSVVVPVRDEAGNILPLLYEIDAALRGCCDFEIIYVDDGSLDGTSAQLAEARVLFARRLLVLRHKAPCGQSQALLTGIAAARAQLVATLDGDGQNDPADIPRLLERWRQSRATSGLMLVGWRAHRRDQMGRVFCSGLARWARAALLADDTPDAGCGLKLFPRDAFLALPRFDSMHRFLPALMARQGGRIESIPVNHRPRWHGRSKYGIWRRIAAGLVDLMMVRWLTRRFTVPEIERNDV